MKQIASIDSPRCIRKLTSKIDDTSKYLFELKDGNIIEAVLMRYKYGLSVCISSQVGCKMGCKFCASAKAGFVRNLTAGEMLGQIVYIQEDKQREAAGPEDDQGKTADPAQVKKPERVRSVVVMGIGEPFDNYDNLMKFLRLLHHPDGLNIGYRHITVSTSGLIPEIEKFIKENIPVNLAVSLHAPNDTLRRTIMPIARKYPIDKLIAACKIYTEISRRRITFEYAMISGVNDTRETAIELAQLLKGMLCHVNLIPANKVDGTKLNPSSQKNIEDFKKILERNGIETTIRRELGSDISAACGQLRRSAMIEGV
jgi:23S rRNA (adenine2503-C2)-methyltransferase